jgi:hypothetical protein
MIPAPAASAAAHPGGPDSSQAASRSRCAAARAAAAGSAPESCPSTIARDAATRPPPARGEGRRQVGDAAALRAHARQQEGGAGHQLAHPLEVAGLRRPDDGAHVGQPLARGRGELVHEPGQALPQRLAPAEPEVLDVRRPRVGRAHEHEHAGVRLPGGGDQRQERVAAQEGAGRERVHAEAGHVARGGGRDPHQRLGVGGRRHGHVAALGVRDHEEPRGAGCLDRPRQRRPAGRAQPLEAGQLELGRDAGGAGGGEDLTAVGGDRGPRPLRRRPAGLARRGLRPQAGGVGVEAEHHLRAALGHVRGQSVAEAHPPGRAGPALGGG